MTQMPPSTTQGSLFNWGLPHLGPGPFAGYLPPGLTGPKGVFGNGSIVDKIPADMLYLVDPHWNQFPPLEPLMYNLLALFVILAGIVAICGNSVVVYVFLTTRGLRTPSNLLVVNLAFSDFLMMFTMMPFMAISNYYETWAFGPVMCEIYGFFGSVSGCMSIWSMGAISIDRYNVIVKGIAAQPMTYKKALLMIFLVDVSSIIWCILPWLGWSRYVPEGNMTVCGTDSMSEDWWSRSYVLVYGGWCYFLPFLVIVYCYIWIVKAVAAHESQMRDQAKKMNVQSLRSSDGNKASAEIRLAKIAMMTITLWFIAWTPYCWINFKGIFSKADVTPVFTVWGSVFAKCAAVYNPIVYGISHPRYRAALYQKFPCLACKTDYESEEDVRSTMTSSGTSDRGAGDDVSETKT